MLDEILRALDRRTFCADVKAAGVDGEDERSAPSLGRPWLGRVLRRRLLPDELSGDDLAPLAVD